MAESRPTEFSFTVENYCNSQRRQNLFPTRITYNENIDILLGVSLERFNKNRIYEVKARYMLQEMGLHLGDVNILCCRSSGKKVLCSDMIESELIRVHDNDGHCGRDVTQKRLLEIFESVPRPLILMYIKQCPICSKRKVTWKEKAEVPVISAIGPMDCLQVDFIDLRAQPDGEMQWILHVQDQYSKFIWAEAVENKECVHVTPFLSKIFYSFGPPKTLHTDDSPEFRGIELNKFITEKFPDVEVINSKGLQRTCGSLDTRLSALISENKKGWRSELDVIVYAVNTSYSRQLRRTPFEAMFSRKVIPGSVIVEKPEIMPIYITNDMNVEAEEHQIDIKWEPVPLPLYDD